MMEVLRERSEDSAFLGEEWHRALEAFKNNRSVVGFMVEQMIISRLASSGVNAGHLAIKAASIITFQGTSTRLLNKDGRVYHVPLKFNLKAVDAIYVSVNAKQKTALVVPIQITVAKKHGDSVGAFFEDWATWSQALANYNITVRFMWIHDSERGLREVEAKTIKLKGRDVSSWPRHDVVFVSVEQVDKDLAMTLEKIRPSDGDGDGDGGGGKWSAVCQTFYHCLMNLPHFARISWLTTPACTKQ
jgi:hypothetical protein